MFLNEFCVVGVLYRKENYYIQRRRIAVIVKAPGQSFLVLLWETRVHFSMTALIITMV